MIKTLFSMNVRRVQRLILYSTIIIIIIILKKINMITKKMCNGKKNNEAGQFLDLNFLVPHSHLIKILR